MATTTLPRRILIKDKLAEMGMSVSDFSLGDFDKIGEWTARKSREPNSDLYKSVGCYFRPNYERGILIYALIKRYGLRSYFEIGFGRGYSALCAAKAFDDLGNDGVVHSVDIARDETQLRVIREKFPAPWVNRIQLVVGDSAAVLPQILQKYDLIYVDGDHTYQATKRDWSWAEQHFNHFCLMDDYTDDAKPTDEIACKFAIDEIQGYQKELIVTDRRIFLDDRGMRDDQVRYGQVLISRTPAR